MKMKQLAALVMALLLALSTAGCGAAGDDTSASVQSVAMLMGVDLSGSSQFGGVVEAKATVKVNKDDSKTVEECYVSVGDQVEAGDVLFSYDADALELSVSSAELEAEQLENSITSYESQISELQKEKKKASSSDQLSYTLQIQEAELNKSEAEYNLKQKQAEVQRLKDSMDEVEVKAEVSGIVQAINDPDSTTTTTSYGSTDDSYITIMETGTYRIKGTASEEAIREMTTGMAVTAYSRTDSTQTWTGTIDSINTGSTESDSGDSNYYSESDGESSAKYAFYVALDSSDGLLIGQHVYLKVGEDAAEDGSDAIRLSSGYLTQEEDSAWVWADNGSGKLEKRTVTLGTYDEELDEYEITDGLTLEDYIAYPDDTLTEGMSTVRYDESSFSGEDVSYDEGEYTEDGSYTEEVVTDEGEYTDEAVTEDGYTDEAVTEDGTYTEDTAVAEDGVYTEDAATATAVEE